MKVGFFPGCSLEGTAKEFERSLRNISLLAGVELDEVKDWNCCGATSAHSLNHLLSVALPARILALAEQQGYDELVVPCAACYSRLLSTKNEILTNDKLRKKIPDIIEMPFTNNVRPLNVIDFINKYLLEFIKKNIKYTINKKIACYYGCLLVRPPKIANVERYEDPIDMENIVKILGGTPINWAYKVECCGASLSISKTDLVAKLSSKIVEDAFSRGAEAILVACPMCHSNLDMRRQNINKYLNKKISIPVIYITQLIGMALGLDENLLNLKKHFIPVEFTFIDNEKTTVDVETKTEKEVVA